MAHRCKISNKSNQYGHRVSHANNKRKHTFKANLQKKVIFLPESKIKAKVKLSTRMLRTIDKLGIKATLKKYNLSEKDLLN